MKDIIDDMCELLSNKLPIEEIQYVRCELRQRYGGNDCWIYTNHVDNLTRIKNDLVNGVSPDEVHKRYGVPKQNILHHYRRLRT